MHKSYKSIEYKLHESLVQIEEAFKWLDFDQEQLSAIRESKELLKTKKYTIAVMGEFKRGKSSLINSLLGAKILPADSTPATATINRITYRPEPKVTVTYNSGSVDEIRMEELADYVTKLTPQGEARAMSIQEATVYFPTVICQNHVDIIDTPGLNDDERMTRITIGMLQDVDAVLVPIHARSPFSETEKRFVCQLLESENIHDIMFVVTFIDQLDEEDYEYDTFLNDIKKRIRQGVFAELEKTKKGPDVLKRAHACLDNCSICGVSSTLALKYFVTNNRELLKKSRFEEFKAELMRVTTAKQVENAAARTLRTLRTAISFSGEQNKKILLRLQTQQRSVEQMQAALQQYCNAALKQLDQIFAKNYEALNTCGRGLFPLKSAMMQEFIRRLSAVRENEHQTIHEALKAALPACDALAENAIAAAVLSVAKQLEKDAALFQAFRAQTLGTGFDTISSFADGKFEQTDVSMRLHTQHAFKSLHFEWNKSPIPAVPDLAAVSPIETVIGAVDVSVNRLVADFDGCVSSIRMRWFSFVQEELACLKASAFETLNQQSTALDMHTKAQQRNFAQFTQESARILSESEAMLAELAQDA